MKQKIIILVVAAAALFLLSPKTLSPTQEAANIFEACQQEPYSRAGETCYAKEFRKLAEKKGPEQAFTVLRELQKLDTAALGCHLVAHGIGSGAVSQNPASWQTLINTLDTACSYGAIHGVIENHVASRGLKPETISTLCGSDPRADCNHIVGHLILVEGRANVDQAISLCNVFTDNLQKDLCLSGVFMEYQTARNLIAHGLVGQDWSNLPARVAELEKMCRFYQGQVGVACWQEIVHAALEKFSAQGGSASGGDLANKMFDFCATAQIMEAARRCSRHAIAVLAAHYNFELSNLTDICLPQKNDASFENDCYMQIVDTTLSNLPQEGGRVGEFCSSLEKKFQAICYNQIKKNVLVETHITHD